MWWNTEKLLHIHCSPLKKMISLMTALTKIILVDQGWPRSSLRTLPHPQVESSGKPLQGNFVVPKHSQSYSATYWTIAKSVC